MGDPVKRNFVRGAERDAEMHLLQLRHEPINQRRERVKRQVLDDRLGFEQRSINRTRNQSDRGCALGLYPCGVQEVIQQAVQRQDTRSPWPLDVDA
jgi:hypothetical protein